MVDPTHTFFIIDNAVNGFSLHRMDDGVCIQTYQTQPTKMHPKQVALGEGATTVTGGGDNSVIYVFSRATGELLQSLIHSSTGRMQMITVRTIMQK